MASGTATATLSLARYRVTLEALEPLALPEYLGSTLRGAFGHAFRAMDVGKGATFGLGGYRLEEAE